MTYHGNRFFPLRPLVGLLLATQAVISVSVNAQGFESLMGMLPELPSFSDSIGKGAIRSDTLEQLETAASSKPLSGPVASPSCTATPTLTDFFAIRPNAQVGPRVTLEMLRQRGPKLTDLWNILRSTQMGSAILRKFEPKYGYEFRVIFAPIPKKGESLAAALYRPADKTILIQPDREAGEIAFVLLHEMVHALDGDYRRALDREKELRAVFTSHLEQSVYLKSKAHLKPVKNAPKREPYPLALLAQEYELLRQFRDMRVYRAERFAYDASYEAWKELSSLYPEYYSGRGLSGSPVHYTDEWLAKILKIRPAYLQKYAKGECRPLQSLKN